MSWEEEGEEEEMRSGRRRRSVPEGSSLMHEKTPSMKLSTASMGQAFLLAGGRTEALGQRDAEPGSCGHFSRLSTRKPTQRASKQPGKAMTLTLSLILMQGWRRPQCQTLLYPSTMVQLGPAWSGSRGTPSSALLELLWARGTGTLPKHILTECLQTGCPDCCGYSGSFFIPDEFLDSSFKSPGRGAESILCAKFPKGRLGPAAQLPPDSSQGSHAARPPPPPASKPPKRQLAAPEACLCRTQPWRNAELARAAAMRAQRPAGPITTPATPSPVPCVSRWPNRGRSGVM
ncbi:hypothetical protein QTO34_000354, partial [Cnephaeus nilssonii]